MLALRIFGFLTCLSAIYAAPIPEPQPLNPGDIVSVAPKQATTAYGDSSAVHHPGVVLGHANQFGKHQVAIITNHPPSSHDQKHQLLANFQPGHKLSTTSHVGTSHPATVHESNLKPWAGGGHAALAHHELTHLKDKIHENGGKVWGHTPTAHAGTTGGSTHNAAAGSSSSHHQPAAAHPAPGRTLRGAAHAVIGSHRLNPLSQAGRKKTGKK